MQRKRELGLDLLKITATMMVIILHVNGYSYSLQGEEMYSFPVLVSYYVLEGVACPAILLFVFIGSWFMIDHVKPLKQISYIWSQTWIVAVLGLVGYILLVRDIPEIRGGVSCAFPFLGWAYWYVTDYIILIILAPVLNRLIAIYNTNRLLIITAVWFCIISVFPTFLFLFGWNQEYSHVGQFILYYLLVANIKKIREKSSKIIMHKKGLWSILWILSASTLIISALLIHIVRPGKELYFYQNNSPIVILEAIALFIVFLNFNAKNAVIRKTAEWIQSSSLVVYLVHMHPLFKKRYDEWRILQYINVSSPGIYVLQTMLTVFAIFIIGTTVGKLV